MMKSDVQCRQLASDHIQPHASLSTNGGHHYLLPAHLGVVRGWRGRQGQPCARDTSKRLNLDDMKVDMPRQTQLLSTTVLLPCPPELLLTAWQLFPWNSLASGARPLSGSVRVLSWQLRQQKGSQHSLKLVMHQGADRSSMDGAADAVGQSRPHSARLRCASFSPA